MNTPSTSKTSLLRCTEGQDHLLGTEEVIRFFRVSSDINVEEECITRFMARGGVVKWLIQHKTKPIGCIMPRSLWEGWCLFKFYSSPATTGDTGECG